MCEAPDPSAFVMQTTKGQSNSDLQSPGNSSARHWKIPGLRWWIIVLIFLAAVLNYVDRQTLSAVAIGLYTMGATIGATIAPYIVIPIAGYAFAAPSSMSRNSSAEAMCGSPCSTSIIQVTPSTPATSGCRSSLNRASQPSRGTRNGIPSPLANEAWHLKAAYTIT